MSTPSPSSSSALSAPPQYRFVGVILAIGSGLLIGSSFVFKKKGLLSSQEGRVAGEGVAYLKSPMWWTGMIMMILGEICNFAAYAFVEAIIVTPMGALSVVISALLSHFFLKERLSTFGWISSVQCLLGAAILALNGPEEQSVSTIIEFRHLFVTPWFLSYAGVVIIAAAVLAFYVAPRWGKESMLPYIGVCSLIGGLSVSSTQGLGACILTSIRGENQFKNWFIYFLLVFVIITLLTEIYYLNIALALFNTAMVTPTYYVTFTFCTLVTSVILYKGLKAPASQIVTIALAFAVICTGIFILQMSKVDPRKLTFVDERTTLLLEAAKQEVDPQAARGSELQRSSTLRSRHSRRSVRSGTQGSPSSVDQTSESRFLNGDRLSNLTLSPRLVPAPDQPDVPEIVEMDELSEKQAIVEKTEEPGLDSLRGVGGALGTIIRAKRRARALSAASAARRSTDEASTDRRSSHSRDSGAGGRPSGWLRGVWTSPKPSRFRAAEPLEKVGEVEGANGQEIRDIEKGTAHRIEVEAPSEDGGEFRRSEMTSPSEHGSNTPLAVPRSPSTTRSAHSVPRTPSAVHFHDCERAISAPSVPSIQSQTRMDSHPSHPQQRSFTE